MQAHDTQELGEALAFGSALLFASVFGKPFVTYTDVLTISFAARLAFPPGCSYQVYFLILYVLINACVIIFFYNFKVYAWQLLGR